MKSLVIIAILWLLSANSFPCEKPFKLHIGIVPWAPAQMNQIWASRLKPHLESYCIDATFSSAHSFKEFIKKTLNQEFDVVDVPPNIGSFLNLKKNMPIVALEDWQAELLYVVHHESAIRSVSDISNHKVVLPDPLSVVTMLAKPRLGPRTNQITYVPNHHVVLSRVLQKQAFVGALISPMFNSLESVVQDRLRIIGREGKNLPGLLINTGTLTIKESDQLLKALMTFNSGNTQMWQRWLAPSQSYIQQMHHDFRDHVKILNDMSFN